MSALHRRALLAAVSAAALAGCHPYTRWEPREGVIVRGGDVYLELPLLEGPEDDQLLSAPVLESERCTFRDAVEQHGDYNVHRALTIRSVAPNAPVRPAAAANTARLRAVYGEEHEALAAAGRSPLVGVALSGGGVRSASFAQGVLQGLHELGFLENVGYLSTVSGGGYTGAWYVTHHEVSDAELLGPASPHLHHLAQYGNYLASGHYTGSFFDYARNVAVHQTFLPAHLLWNVLLDFDVNVGSLRRFYREGIVRAYLYDEALSAGSTLVPETSTPIRWLDPARTGRPFWIANMNLSLIDDDTHHRARIGDVFELTPLRAGSNAVGYVETPVRSEPYEAWSFGSPVDYDGADEFLPFLSSSATRWMTPEYATAISGAAVDSKGLAGEANGAVFYALELLNWSLGYYVPGWSEGWVAGDGEPLTVLGHYLTTLAPLSSFVASHGRTTTAKEFYLSDGGHVENLGLYALVRRGCRLIVVADATQEAGVNDWADATPDERGALFSDLRRCEELLLGDMGARLEIDWEALDGRRGFAFVGKIRDLPVLAPFAAKGVTPAGGGPSVLLRDVTVVYLKAAMSNANHPLDAASFVNAEKAQDASFPHRSTADIEWSERQVLAQREHGRRLVLDRAAEPLREALGSLGQRPADPRDCPLEGDATRAVADW